MESNIILEGSNTPHSFSSCLLIPETIWREKPYSTIWGRIKKVAMSYILEITRISYAQVFLDVLGLRLGGGISTEEKRQREGH